MNAKRMSVKLFVENPDAVDLAMFMPIFQRWIQFQGSEKEGPSVDGMLIDAIGYKHVHEGPGIVLIGHEGDYGMDMAGGRPGLLYTRKRDLPGGVRDTLPVLLRNALTACRMLQGESALNGAITFRTDEVQISLLDRLKTPNTVETVAALKEEVQPVLAALYGEAELDMNRVYDDARRPASIIARAEQAPELEVLLDRLVPACAGIAAPVAQ